MKSVRILGVSIAMVLAVNGGVIAVEARVDDASDPSVGSAVGAVSAEVGRELAAHADLDPVVEIEVSKPSSDDLPTPERPPKDPYAPTPEVVHGTLEIPRLGLTQPLQEGVTLTAINRGPSHWPGTAMPGELGNVVVAGHRTTYSRPFRNVDQLVPGDELIFRLDATGVFTYVVTSTEIVDPSRVDIIDQTPEHRATIFACHPPGSARQRIVVHFELASAEWAEAA